MGVIDKLFSKKIESTVKKTSIIKTLFANPDDFIFEARVEDGVIIVKIKRRD